MGIALVPVPTYRTGYNYDFGNHVKTPVSIHVEDGAWTIYHKRTIVTEKVLARMGYTINDIDEIVTDLAIAEEDCQ